MKWKLLLPFTDLFSRRFESNDFELAGLLAHLSFCGLPVAMYRNSGGDCKKVIKAYSCGYSSGIAPDSLFRLTPESRKLVNQIAAKVENK
jgi:hypothetical protein